MDQSEEATSGPADVPRKRSGNRARSLKGRSHRRDIFAQPQTFCSITHLVLASCTGFTASGLDQRLVDRLGLDPSVERTAIGFMAARRR